MAISNFLRGITGGAASIGRAVQAAGKKLDEAVTPKPETAGMEAPEPSTTAPSGWSLPEIGAAPDPNDPRFSGEEGKAAFEEAMEDYTHKQDIHQAFMDLDKIYREAHPDRDFRKEYLDEIAAQQQHETERPKGSNLARAALALGDFNPAVQQSGRSNLQEYNQRVAGEQERSDVGFSQRMTLRQKMHEDAAQAAEKEGNWRKALAEREKAALLAVDAASLEHKRGMEKEEVRQTAITERQRIKADSAKKTAQIRADVLASNYGLSGGFLKEFQKEVAKAIAKNFGPRDLTKEYDVADLDRLTDVMETLAEIFHDRQFGDGSAPKYNRTHPSKRPVPKEETAEGEAKLPEF